MKAILVLDEMPKYCADCPCMHKDEWEHFYYCYANDYCDNSLNITDRFDHRPGWCPLKDMPRKLDANDWHRMFSGLFSEREAKGYGWNACLEEINK